MDLLNRLTGNSKNKTILVADKEYLQLVQLRRGELVCNEIRKQRTGDNTLSELLKLSDYPVKRVIFLIPGNRLLFSAFKIPKEARNRLEEIIDLKFLSKLTLPREDLYHSYYLIENKENLTVLAFAVKREFINHLYALCQSSGLKVVKILPLSLLYYLFHRKKGIEGLKYQNRTIIYLDYYHNFGHFTIIGPEKLYLRGSPAGDIAAVEIELNKVLTYIVRTGGKNPALLLNGREISIDELDEVEEAQEDREDYQMDGENSQLNGNETVTTKYLEVDINNLEKIVNDKPLTENYQKLFWREVSKLLDNRRNSQQTLDFKKQLPTVKRGRKRRSCLGIWLLVGLIILLNILTLAIKWQLEEERLKLINEQLTLISGQVEEVTQLKENYRIKREKLELYKGILKEDTGSYLPWLAELSRLLPADTEINNLNFQGKKLTLLEGKATSASLVLGKLEASPYFSNLKFLGSIENIGDREFFRIAGDLQDDIE